MCAGPFDLNIIALIVTLSITGYMLLGIRQSSTLNNIITILSIVIILFVIVAGTIKVSPSNWNDFMPFGVQGVLQGASLVFFAYIGFEVIANFSEDVEDPNRNIPFAIIGSLVICCVLYVCVSLVVTGMVPYDLLDPNAPLSVRRTLADSLTHTHSLSLSHPPTDDESPTRYD
jgi:basic amino acid/polyamine antiporter, APA family